MSTQETAEQLAIYAARIMELERLLVKLHARLGLIIIDAKSINLDPGTRCMQILDSAKTAQDWIISLGFRTK